MKRVCRILLAVSLAACGGKAGDNTTLCDGTASEPAACSQACDPSPNAPNTCPSGYHCNQAGVCDALCVIGDDRCPAGTKCSADGYCNDDGTGIAGTVDADCPAIHFTPTRVTPSIELVLDRSGSMAGTRYNSLKTALFDPTNGAIVNTQAQVYFGEMLFSGSQTPCTDGPPGSLNITNFSTNGRVLNNATAMSTLTTSVPGPSGSTPTSAALDTAATLFTGANAPPAGSPPIILLATDGEPNACDGSGDSGRSVSSTAQNYADGIRTYVIGIDQDVGKDFLQAIANAGVGKTSGAPYYVATNPQELTDAFNAIITSAISCDVTINQMVDPASAPHATVTLNGTTLVYGTDWTLGSDKMTIHIQGAACATLKNTPGADVEATFPCGSVIQ